MINGRYKIVRGAYNEIVGKFVSIVTDPSESVPGAKGRVAAEVIGCCCGRFPKSHSPMLSVPSSLSLLC